MDDPNTKPPVEQPADELAQRLREPGAIDALMAMPVRDRSKITVFGDDAVTGINPAPATKT